LKQQKHQQQSTQHQSEEKPPEQHPKLQIAQKKLQEREESPQGQNRGLGDSDGINPQLKGTPKPNFDHSHVQQEK